MKRLGVWVLLAVAGVTGLLASPSFAQSGPEVLRLDLEGTVDPLAARYVRRGLDEASVRGSAAVLLRIDTPGGLDSSMRSLVRDIQASPVPVICWVGPAGARAASAGAFILTGCPLAAMAPGTNVGAASPVGFQGEILSEKITNDAAAYIRSLAERFDRNPDWAERTVREAVSATAEEALGLGAIDLLAANIAALLQDASGKAVQGPGGDPVTLGTAGATPVSYEMAFLESLLHNAIDPNLAFLLLVLGLGGIAFEILSPGVQVGGIFGGVALILALLILGMLPVNLAGIALIVLGLALFVLEAYIPGGVAGVAGLVALLAGGMLLFDPAVPNAQVSRGLIVGTAVALTAFFLVVVRAVMRAQKQKPSAATTDDLVGEEGTVEAPLEPVGIVRVRNEAWTARTAGEPIATGTPVRVVSVDGLTLEVEPVTVTAPSDTEKGA